MKSNDARCGNYLGRTRALTIVMVTCLAVTELPTRAAQPVVALRARAMIDIARERLIENATVDGRCAYYWS